jgi:hypothetical protein
MNRRVGSALRTLIEWERMVRGTPHGRLEYRDGVWWWCPANGWPPQRRQNRRQRALKTLCALAPGRVHVRVWPGRMAVVMVKHEGSDSPCARGRRVCGGD